MNIGLGIGIVYKPKTSIPSVPVDGDDLLNLDDTTLTNLDDTDLENL